MQFTKHARGNRTVNFAVRVKSTKIIYSIASNFRGVYFRGFNSDHKIYGVVTVCMLHEPLHLFCEMLAETDQRYMALYGKLLLDEDR